MIRARGRQDAALYEKLKKSLEGVCSPAEGGTAGKVSPQVYYSSFFSLSELSCAEDLSSICFHGQ